MLSCFVNPGREEKFSEVPMALFQKQKHDLNYCEQTNQDLPALIAFSCLGSRCSVLSERAFGIAKATQ